MPSSPDGRSKPRPHSRGSPPKENSCDSSPKSYGQIIEYIQDRLYLASYTHEPDVNTPFPYPPPQQTQQKRSSRTAHSVAANSVSQNQDSRKPIYLSIDDYLLYNAFCADFGPLHIGHVYRFSILLHQALSVPEHEDKPLVFWSYADSRSRANAACILACYMILVQKWPPHLALAPLAQMDPPPMPFRDAGYSQADFTLTIQDVVYGVWRAREEGLCGLAHFDLEEYERHERVENGDFNWITQNFVALASPQHQPIDIILPSSSEYAAIPKCTSAIYQSDLPLPFKHVLGHFRARKVGLIVRLNSELYSPSYFTALGIKHLDMIFEDGTCPPLALVRKFIKLSHEMITIKKKQVAVHCKAGLGRTGCLIGAYLIYRYGFTANETIAYMRFMRPGMVVGPQQHWLHLNQGTFRQWWYEESMRDKLALAYKSTPTTSLQRQGLSSSEQLQTPPSGSQKRRALGELDYNEQDTTTGVQDENLPAPTPGQPRKTSKKLADHHKMPGGGENGSHIEADTEVVSYHRHVKEDFGGGTEVQLHMSATQPSPTGMQKQRAQSCITTTTLTTTEWTSAGGLATPSPAVKSPLRGLGSLSVSKRSSPIRRINDGKPAGVRKSSGRVGSAGAISHATKIKQ